MFELMVVSLMAVSFGWMASDATSDFKGNKGIEIKTDKEVCIIRDDVSEFLVRYDDGKKVIVNQNNIKPIDELCI